MRIIFRKKRKEEKMREHRCEESCNRMTALGTAVWKGAWSVLGKLGGFQFFL